jgi:tetratricopeptide (TPR) repeat protein
VASEQAKELRKQGIALIKAGDREQARKILQQAIRLDPTSEAGWSWLATVAKDQREKVFCLYKLLEINPNSEVGLASLQQLGMTREQLNEQMRQQIEAVKSGQAAPAPAVPVRSTVEVAAAPVVPPAQDASPFDAPAAKPAPEPERTGSLLQQRREPEKPRPQPRNLAQGPGIPVADPEYINYIHGEIDPIVREYMKPPMDADVRYTRKTSGRAGERDIWILRGWIAGAVAGIMALLCGIGTLVVISDPELRGIVFAPTWTVSPTPLPPTATFTSTPGNTPTASPTPRLTLTPSPTVNAQVNNGAVQTPTPTPIYPPVSGRALEGAIGLIDAGQLDAAIPTLVMEVTNVAAAFEPNPYYYQALALVEQGELDDAQDLIEEAGERLRERTTNPVTEAQINAARAYIDTLVAERELAGGRSEETDTLLQNAQDLAELAISRDPRMELAYIALARRHLLDEQYTEAISALDDGLEVPQLINSLRLTIEKARVYLAQGEYERADYQAYLALYTDPFNEAAFRVRTEIALSQNRPGLAVLRAQEWLFYYPGSAAGYRLLGDARRAEGNLDLALTAYDQALAGGDDPQTLIARAEVNQLLGRFEQARDDLTAAARGNNTPELRVLRLQAAVDAGNFAAALRDIEALLGEGVLPDDELNLLKGRLLVESAGEDSDEAYQDARDLLETLLDGGSLTADQSAQAEEYQARAQYALRQYPQALESINAALGGGASGGRYYWRGLILEASGQDAAALRDYEWVLALGQLYSYPFLPDAEARAADLR